MVSRIVRVLLVVAAFAVVMPGMADAGPIGPGGFVNPYVEDFTGLGLPFHVASGYHLNGATYGADSPNMRYTDWGCCGASFGESFGTDALDTGSFFDVFLDTPSVRAGGWMGISWGIVEFFDQFGVLLGAVDLGVSGSGAPSVWAGWDAGTSLIKHMRFTDMSANGQIATIDRVTWETSSVPEPASLMLVGGGLLALAVSRRRRR